MSFLRVLNKGGGEWRLSSYLSLMQRRHRPFVHRFRIASVDSYQQTKLTGGAASSSNVAGKSEHGDVATRSTPSIRRQATRLNQISEVSVASSGDDIESTSAEPQSTSTASATAPPPAM